MAGLALSFNAPNPCPRLVASRRVDFHLQKHSFSKWKYRQVDLLIAASHAIRDILVQDGIPAAQIVVVHDGIDVGKIGRLPTADIHAEFWLPHGVPVLVNVGALVPHKGQKFLVQAMPQVLTVHAGVTPHAGPKRVSGGVGCTAAAPAAWPAPAWTAPGRPR